MMAKMKRYEEGGVTEGENANIDDDTRARALAWVKRQSENSEEVKSTPVGPRRPVSRTPSSSSAPRRADPAVTDTGESGDSARLSRMRASTEGSRGIAGIPGRVRTKEEMADMPDPTASGSELGRFASNALAAGAGRLPAQAARSLAVTAADKLDKAKAVARVKDLRSSREAWSKGPRGPLGRNPDAEYKKGGSVKGWGKARGGRAAKIV